MTIDHAGRPSAGQLKLVVLVDDLQFHSIIEMEAIEGLTTSMEARIQDGKGARTSLETQMSLRSWVAEALRSKETGKASFDRIGGAACLWLTLHHYREGARMREAVRAMADRGATLTVSIANSKAAAPGTAWSFVVGDDMHDGRAHLADHDPGMISVYGPGEERKWRDQKDVDSDG